MSRRLSRLGLLAALLAAACAGSPDHFYTLTPLPEATGGPPTAPAVQLLLNVTIPELMDRSEMVLSTSSNGISILEHERWALSLSEHVSQTLARDIERRRPDILVANRGFDHAGTRQVSMTVDIVRLSVHRGGQASLEARWHLVDASAGTDELGSAALSEPLGSNDYSAIAQAYSQALSALADKLAGSVR